jgi:ferredoxin--NADP+ reductase
MLRDTESTLENFGLVEGSNSVPGTFVVERAFVDQSAG